MNPVSNIDGALLTFLCSAAVFRLVSDQSRLFAFNRRKLLKSVLPILCVEDLKAVVS